MVCEGVMDVIELPADSAEVLLGIAWRAIEHRVNFLPVEDEPEVPELDWLNVPAATDALLLLDGQLRGNSTTFFAERSLGADIALNAKGAAARDLRFVEVTPDELTQVELTLSLLSAPERISFDSREDAVARLRPNLDGVILEYGQKKAALMPALWDALGNSEEFMMFLLRKAGLRFNFWSDELILHRFTTQELAKGRFPGIQS